MKNFYQKLCRLFGAILATLLATITLSNSVFAETEPTYPEIYINAVNPGYTVDGVSNVGELIELKSATPNTSISLAGLSIGYTNSSGESMLVVEFPENSWLVGESILLRLASSSGSELAAVNYKSTQKFRGLGFSAGLELKRGDTVLDAVCWTSKNSCYPSFKSSSPTTLLRTSPTEFTAVDSYEPVYDEKSYYVDEPEIIEPPSQCKGLIFTEVLSYYDESPNDQFIELHNSTSEQILLDGCSLRYKNKYYSLSGIMKPDAYLARYLTDFSITKNPTTSATIELIDTTSEVLTSLTYPNGQKKATSYALIGYQPDGTELWRTTFAPTPGEPNNYQEFRTCEEGKVINTATGNCVKVTVVKEKTCPAGQYLNPLTGRCNKIPTIKAATTCIEGYELNPETGRCRKIKVNDGADYSLATVTYKEESSFIALYAVLGVIGVGLIYVIYEFRQEIMRLFRKVFRQSR